VESTRRADASEMPRDRHAAGLRHPGPADGLSYGRHDGHGRRPAAQSGKVPSPSNRPGSRTRPLPLVRHPAIPHIGRWRFAMDFPYTEADRARSGGFEVPQGSAVGSPGDLKSEAAARTRGDKCFFDFEIRATMGGVRMWNRSTWWNGQQGQGPQGAMSITGDSGTTARAPGAGAPWHRQPHSDLLSDRSGRRRAGGDHHLADLDPCHPGSTTWCGRSSRSLTGRKLICRSRFRALA